jgi:hypothetical protein
MQLAASVRRTERYGASGWLDPGDKPRDDNGSGDKFCGFMM